MKYLQMGSYIRNFRSEIVRGLAVLLVLALLVVSLPAPTRASIELIDTHVWSYLSAKPGALLGSTLDSAGDVNGDGFSDVVVGAYLYERNDDLRAEGRAYLFYGTLAGLEPEPAWSIYGGAPFTHYAWAVASAGDVNGDGYADVATSANRCIENPISTGVVYVFHGGASGLASTPNWTENSPQANACFGYALASAGDVNGDGYDDLLVGAPYYEDDTLTNEGAVFLYFGSASGLNATPQRVFLGGQANANLGMAIAGGNFNADNYSDVILAAPGYTNPLAGEGQVQVYFGSASGPSAAADWSGEGNQMGAGYGSSVSEAGDVNGDGYVDLLVGADTHDNPLTNEGAAFLYLGSSTGISLTPIWSYSGGDEGGNLGCSVSKAGDINGDGYDDLLLGASHFSDPESAEGAAFVFWGGAAGPASIPDWSHQLNQPNAMLGSAVSEAGDVNNDGFADIMVGAPGYESSWLSDEGMVKVFLGESGGLIEPLIDFSLTPNPILEGSPITLFGSFTAADPAANFTLTVAWGDGSPNTVAVLGTARSFDAQHTFADNGTYIVSVSLSDSVGIPLEDTAPVTVQNVAPTLALSGAGSVGEGVNYLLGIGAVVDPGDDTLTACQIDWGDGSPLQDCLSAVGGTLGHIFPNGPASHTVHVHLTDEDGNYQNVDTLLVDVTNVAPVAVEDEFTTPPDHTTTIPAPGVLANDSDVPADSLTASLVSGANTGTLSLQPDGSFTYTPPSGFMGTVTFTYRVTDADGGVSNTATVTLTVDNIYLYLPVLKH